MGALGPRNVWTPESEEAGDTPHAAPLYEFARYPDASGPLARTAQEEITHRQKQSCEREYDEQDLVDVVSARRQSTQKVRQPEDGIVPQGEPGPLLPASVGDHGDQDPEETHAYRGYANRPQPQGVTRTGPRGDDLAEGQDAQPGDRQRNPADLEPNVFSLGHRVELTDVDVGSPPPRGP